jgi:hypothetical protein
MLRKPVVGRVNDFVPHNVRTSTGAPELLEAVVKRGSVLSDQALDVLQQESSGAFRVQCGNDVIDDLPATSFIADPLTRAHCREGLAGKASNIEVMVRKLVGVPLADVFVH